MSDVLAAALIAAVTSVTGSVLTFIVGFRSVRRSVGTSTGEPLGQVLEARLDRIERHLDAMQHSIGLLIRRLWVQVPPPELFGAGSATSACSAVSFRRC
jgi:hypothetical protein